ncbi:MAG: hypothetical protein JXB36_09475 [Gammaproteobacteria bacterium]|nr:hypothetical protein [Gammaproteobacteria bacterium]
MVARILTAVVGGSAVTIAMLLGMHEATRHFKDMDPTRYFSIVDFIPAPETSNRPEPPPAPSAQPDRPSLKYERGGDARVPFQRPVVEQELPEADPGLRPSLPPASDVADEAGQ